MATEPEAAVALHVTPQTLELTSNSGELKNKREEDLY